MNDGSTLPPEAMARLRAALESELAEGRVEVPLLPDVAVKILSTPLTEETDVGGLAELTQRDQTLAAHVLQVANSAAFSGGKQVFSIKEAIVKLGLSNLREIVVAVAFKARLFAVPEYEVFLQRAWQESAATAAYAKELAGVCGVESETAFLCALMHNVGQPALLMKILDLRAQLPEGTDATALLSELADLERKIGVLVADRWKLPEAVKAVIVWRERWAGVPYHAAETRVVALARMLVANLFEPGALDESTLHDQPICQALDLDRTALAQVLARKDKIIAFAESFG